MADSKFKTRVKAQAGVQLPAELINRALTVDAAGDVKSSAVTTTELGHVSGVTSAIQTQLDAKATTVSLNNHINNATAAHAASAISNTAAGNLVAINVQTALNELQSDIDTRALDSAVIKKDGSVAFTANQSMGGFKLTSLGAPTAGSDAATKLYVDNSLEGLKPKQAVRVATTANITLSAVQTIDGIAVVAGNRVLVKDQTLPANNGIYDVAAGAWTRSTDFDSVSPVDEINRAYVAVQEGAANAGKLYVQFGTVTTLGTDAINFTFFNSVSGLIGGDGVTVSGSNISVDHDGLGLQFVATQLALRLDGATLTKAALGLKLSDTAVIPGTYGTATQTSTVIVDQQGRLTSASNTTIAIPSTQVTDFNEAAQDAVGTILTDSATIDFTYNDAGNTITAIVIDASITNAKIASGVDAVKLADGSVSNAEFQFLDGVTSSIQTQLNNKVTATTGDIQHTTFSAANNQAAAANVTGLAFANASVRSFKALVSVAIDATADLFEQFELMAIQKGATWDLSQTAVGDDSGLVFSITNAGQVQYTSTNVLGFVTSTVNFRAIVTLV